MAKAKVTSKFAIAELVEQFVTVAVAEAVGRATVDGAKELIAQGISPVARKGRFERYKDRFKYPGDLKPHRPVNLNLSGKMLRAFGWKREGKFSVKVGMVKGTERDNDLAVWHNAGTEHMEARPFIPLEKGEEWAPRIMREIREIYAERLAVLIERSNRSKK